MVQALMHGFMGWFDRVSKQIAIHQRHVITSQPEGKVIRCPSSATTLTSCWRHHGPTTAAAKLPQSGQLQKAQ